MSSAKCQPFCLGLSMLMWKLQALTDFEHCLETILIDGLVQGCSNSIANTLELLQSCNKPLIY